MARYIVRWEMVYEDAKNEFDAVAQAYGHICEIASDPSIGANFVQVKEIVDTLDREYYSIGITSGHEALANVVSDFLDGYMDETLKEWNLSRKEFQKVIYWNLAKHFIFTKKMWKSHEEWYGKVRR